MPPGKPSGKVTEPIYLDSDSDQGTSGKPIVLNSSDDDDTPVPLKGSAKSGPSAPPARPSVSHQSSLHESPPRIDHSVPETSPYKSPAEEATKFETQQVVASGQSPSRSSTRSTPTQRVQPFSSPHQPLPRSPVREFVASGVQTSGSAASGRPMDHAEGTSTLRLQPSDPKVNDPKRSAQGTSTATFIQNISGPQAKILPQFGSSLGNLNTRQTSLPSAQSPVSSSSDEEIMPDVLGKHGPEDFEDDDSMLDLYDDDNVSPQPHHCRRHSLVRKSSQCALNLSSPLVERLRQQQSKLVRTPKGGSGGQMQGRSQKHQAFAEKVEDILLRSKEEMTEDHAVYVRYALMDARTPIEAKMPRFVDEVSPFASLKPVNSDGSRSDENEILKLVSTSTKHLPKQMKQNIPTTTILSDQPRVPTYTAHINVLRNILSPDDDRLRFVPYLGDFEGAIKAKKKHEELNAELYQLYRETPLESGRENERSHQVRSYLKRWLERLKVEIVGSGIFFEVEMLERYFLATDNWNLDIRDKYIDALLEDTPIPLPESWDLYEIFQGVFEKVFSCTLKGVVLPEERQLQLAEAANKYLIKVGREAAPPTADDPNQDRLGTYANLTCLICHAVCCLTHGAYQEFIESDDSEQADTDEASKTAPKTVHIHQRLHMPFSDALRRQDTRLASNLGVCEEDSLYSAENPCSTECYHTMDDSRSAKSCLIMPEQHATIRSMAISARENKDRSCNISFQLKLPCWRVHNEISSMAPRDIGHPMPEQKKLPWYNNQRKSLKDHWQDMTNAHAHERRGQVSSCTHDGPCDEQAEGECSCYQTGVLCESWCGCTDTCPRRWTGCSCHSNGLNCHLESCICVQMNRECGTQCLKCGAGPRLNPASKYKDEVFATGCQNIFLQRGVSRKLIIGESQIAGFGAYAGERIRKGESFAEYVGEIISSKEADRRGLLYDERYMSFLFDLNSEWVIDAARLGNKTRFINHAESEKDGQNCEAKIMLVSGEHRIKFVAMREIQAGEELLFNYGKKFADKHGLNKKLPKANKHGVVEGKENLDALNGIDSAKRASMRGRGRGGRGGRRPGGGRKARKSAPDVSPGVEEDVADMDVDMEAAMPLDEDDDVYDEEDDEQEDISKVRLGKRKTTMPMRYTR